MEVTCQVFQERSGRKIRDGKEGVGVSHGLLCMSVIGVGHIRVYLFLRLHGDSGVGLLWASFFIHKSILVPLRYTRRYIELLTICI